MDESPYTTPTADVVRRDVESSREALSAVTRAWLIFFLIVTFGGGLLGAVIGGIIGAILGSAGVSANVIMLTTAVLGFFISIPISYFTFRWSVVRYVFPALRA